MRRSLRLTLLASLMLVGLTGALAHSLLTAPKAHALACGTTTWKLQYSASDTSLPTGYGTTWHLSEIDVAVYELVDSTSNTVYCGDAYVTTTWKTNAIGSYGSGGGEGVSLEAITSLSDCNQFNCTYDLWNTAIAKSSSHTFTGTNSKSWTGQALLADCDYTVEAFGPSTSGPFVDLIFPLDGSTFCIGM